MAVSPHLCCGGRRSRGFPCGKAASGPDHQRGAGAGQTRGNSGRNRFSSASPPASAPQQLPSRQPSFLSSFVFTPQGDLRPPGAGAPPGCKEHIPEAGSRRGRSPSCGRARVPLPPGSAPSPPPGVFVQTSLHPGIRHRARLPLARRAASHLHSLPAPRPAAARP